MQLSQQIRRPRVVVGIVAAICLALVVFVLARDFLSARRLANAKHPPVVISATVANPMTWRPGLEAVGTAKAWRGANIAVEAAGVVRAINFSANDRVTAGHLLVQIDDAVERADIIAAEANITLSEAQLARVQKLMTKGIDSKATHDSATAQLGVARSAQARLAAILEQKAIKAPFDGVLGIPQVDVGQYVKEGTVVVTLQALENMSVDFTIPEQAAAEVEIGQSVHFGVTAERLDFSGHIVGVDPKIDPATRLVSIRAVLENSGEHVMPGQFLRVRVDLSPKANVIALPTTSVVRSLYGDFVYRLISQDDPKGKQPAALVAQQAFVTTGRYSGGLVQIVKGVGPGDQIVTAGQNKLQNGTVVAVDNTIDPMKSAFSGAREVQ